MRKPGPNIGRRLAPSPTAKLHPTRAAAPPSDRSRTPSVPADTPPPAPQPVRSPPRPREPTDRSVSSRIETIPPASMPPAPPARSPRFQSRPSISTSRSTIQTSRPRCAPNAIRIPISLVRRATLYATVPYRPTQAMLTASSANRPSRTLTGRTRSIRTHKGETQRRGLNCRLGLIGPARATSPAHMDLVSGLHTNQERNQRAG
jgi:hypothetical protein